jgi:hypothetical protein
MTNHPHDQCNTVVILSLPDKDRRRTSTSTPSTTSIRTTLISGSNLLIAAICYLFSSYRLLITDY